MTNNEYVVYNGEVMTYKMYRIIRESEGFVFPEETKVEETEEEEEEEETE